MATLNFDARKLDRYYWILYNMNNNDIRINLARISDNYFYNNFYDFLNNNGTNVIDKFTNDLKNYIRIIFNNYEIPPPRELPLPVYEWENLERFKNTLFFMFHNGIYNDIMCDQTKNIFVNKGYNTFFVDNIPRDDVGFFVRIFCDNILGQRNNNGENFLNEILNFLEPFCHLVI